MVNFTGELFTLTERAEVYQTAAWAIIAIAIITFWEPKTLAFKRNEFLR